MKKLDWGINASEQCFSVPTAKCANEFEVKVYVSQPPISVLTTQTVLAD